MATRFCCFIQASTTAPNLAIFFNGISFIVSGVVIAQLKQMPLGTVKNKLFRGRQMLKEKLQDFLTD